MPYGDVPAFVEALAGFRSDGSKGAGVPDPDGGQDGEVLKATWDELDFESALWTIPAARMKAKRDHRVPLTEDMLAILRPLHETRISDFVFPGQKPGKPLSNMALETLMKRMKIEGASPHGFRSSFRDWCGDCTSFAREIAEAALAHKAGDSVEVAYRQRAMRWRSAASLMRA